MKVLLVGVIFLLYATLVSGLSLSPRYRSTFAQEAPEKIGGGLLGEITDLIRTQSFYKPSAEDLKEFRECVLKKAFERYEIPKGTGLKENFVVESCFKFDRHARYETPSEYKESIRQMRGDPFYGIGIQFSLTQDGSGVFVNDIIPGGPAEKSGVLEEGDIIVAVGENINALEPLSGKSTQEIVNLIRGKKDTPVTLQVIRGNKKLPPVVIVRGEVVTKEVESREVESGIGYIKITSFQSVPLVTKEVVPVLEEFARRNIGAIIVDLRRNPGGNLGVTFQFLELFSPLSFSFLLEGRDRDDKVIFRYGADGYGKYADWKIAILVDERSASASEIVAGVLQRWGAMVFGTETYGKGSVQTVQSLSDGGALHFTIAHYYFEDGETPEGVGIGPDVEVVREETASGAAVKGVKKPDLVFEKALEYLREELGKH
ncbi:MAG: PDZ domain-containing protein [Candidatus Sungiibacteriota bacterium]|uniref:PDZ domain-containing protein n=1 Tax=Candidatus Sungiibacteriota bacterium TaxID=2750080 RepID=A0A7T5RJX8_9BACT|nr:MAG: PDZ domain-containing protein [Candidatus Sungbacteria bacterium]